MYCGKELHYYLDESVLQEPPTTVDRMLERVETSKQAMASSRNTIDQSRLRIGRESKRKKA